MNTTVSFRADATAQEKANAKASAKTSLLGTAITATGGAIAGGTVGAIAGFLPCKPSIDKVIEGMHQAGDPIAKDYFKKRNDFFEAVRANADTDKLKQLKNSVDDVYKAIAEKAADLIKTAPDSDLIKTAKEATKSMLRPNKIAKGVTYGIMVALLYNIISSFRKPKAQDHLKKEFHG